MGKDLSKYCFQATLLILGFATVSFAQVPQVPHVLIVVEENTDYADVCGPNNTSMPFLCGLKSQGSFSANYYAPTHPSIGNYTDLGWGVVTTNDDNCNPDTCGFPYTANNVVRAVQLTGKTWKGYAESMPSVCDFGGDSGNYAVHHSPIPYISDVQNNCANRYVPFEDNTRGFARDVANNTLPSYSFVTPNMCDNAHDCGLNVADNWLRDNIVLPLSNAGHLDSNTGDTVLIVVFDESGGDNTHGGGKVYWFMMGKGVKKSYQSTGPSNGFYSHESTLRLMAELVGASIVGLGGAATAPDMTEFFGAAANPPVAVLTVTPQTGPAPLQVTADSSGSSDPNGGITSRTIDFGDGTTSNAVTAAHTYDTAGTFTVKLAVSDHLGLSASSSKTVTVQPPQTISVAVTPTAATLSSGGNQQFAAAVSGTTNQSVSWKATVGTITTAGLFIAPVVSITTTITVTATSVADPSKSGTAKVTVQPNGPPPSCTLSVSPSSGPVPLQVNANASCTDPQNALVSTEITWGDGASTSGSSGSHIYANAGTFRVTVTATDSANLTGSASQTVTTVATPTKDFSLSAATGSNCPAGENCSLSGTVTAGQTATYNLQAAPVNGFNGTVTLSCGDPLAKSTCSISPSSVTVNGTASAFAVMVTTTAASAFGPYLTPDTMRPLLQPVLLFLALLFALLPFLARSAFVARRPSLRLVPALAVLILSLAWVSSCGGAPGVGGGNAKTPSGTITVTATSSGVNHSVSLNLTVN